MTEIERPWDTLPNPFSTRDSSGVITGHVSGRARDIKNIVMGAQSALIVTGTTKIGKTALIRYLERGVHSKWSWRNELADMLPATEREHTYFTTIDLTMMEVGNTPTQQLSIFLQQCLLALQKIFKVPKDTEISEDSITDEEQLSSSVMLKQQLRQWLRTAPEGRYFIVLDAINRLGRPERSSAGASIQAPQEQGLALLEQSGAIRILVDLLDQFRNFGVILSLESQPCPNVEHQFSHISPYLSAVLASFNTVPLQIFTWQDATAFLAQTPADFGELWAGLFPGDKHEPLFSEVEQAWIRQQAGTHPYLLQQFCFYTFQRKLDYAIEQKCWSELPPSSQQQLLRQVDQRINLFFTNVWNRLQEAVDKCTSETRTKLYNFFASLDQKHGDMQIDSTTWEALGSEVQFVLSSEGIVRYDLTTSSQPMYYPGYLLAQYLAQKVNENNPSTTRGLWLKITRPNNESEQVLLSDLEYRLTKTLLQHPKRCTEEELMKSAWGKVIDRQTFTQRMYQLRKKLKGASADNDIITNHYGGQYSLQHVEWLSLD